MRRRTTSMVTICQVALAASLSSACVFVVEHGPDRDAQFHYRSRGLTDRFEVWVDGDVTFTGLDDLEAKHPSMWAIVSPPWTLVRFSNGKQELFDLSTGEEKTRDRLFGNGLVITELQHQLAEIYGDGFRAPLVRGGFQGPDDDVMTRLRALGYVR